VQEEGRGTPSAYKRRGEREKERKKEGRKRRE